MAPCSGNALGVERLLMLVCDAKNIAEVVAFPDDNI
jgi:elongation factor P--beta-lysine ligase